MMANANEESSRARNLNDNSTSEVGYVPFITMQEHLTVMRELIQTLVQKPKEEPKKNYRFRALTLKLRVLTQLHGVQLLICI